MSEAWVGKPLRVADLKAIRRAIGETDPPLRAAVARQVCAALGSLAADFRAALGVA